VDIDRLRGWIGGTEALDDIAAAAPLAGLAALLDHETPPWREGEVPPLGHWLYFLPRARQSEIDIDGHQLKAFDASDRRFLERVAAKLGDAVRKSAAEPPPPP